MTNFLIFAAVFVSFGAVVLISSIREGRQRRLFCVGCDHTLLMHCGRRNGFCMSYNVLEDRVCRCMGSNEFVERNQRA